MRNFPLEKYRWAMKPARKDENGKVIAGPKIIAITNYRDETVTGTSQCHPNDFPNMEPNFGLELAAARCDLKVRAKRVAEAYHDYCIYQEWANDMLARAEKAKIRLDRAVSEENEATYDFQKKFGLDH